MSLGTHEETLHRNLPLPFQGREQFQRHTPIRKSFFYFIWRQKECRGKAVGLVFHIRTGELMHNNVAKFVGQSKSQPVCGMIFVNQNDRRPTRGGKSYNITLQTSAVPRIGSCPQCRNCLSSGLWFPRSGWR